MHLKITLKVYICIALYDLMFQTQMSKLQNKLFAKLNRIEEIGQKILLDLSICAEYLASLVVYALAQMEKLMINVKDHEKTFLEVAKSLDSIVNVFVLTINNVGARFLSVDQKEKKKKSCFENCGLKKLSLCSEEELLMVEARKKLDDVFKHEQTLQAFCQLTSRETQTRLDEASGVRLSLKGSQDFIDHSLKLSKSDGILTELSVMVLEVTEKLKLVKLRTGIEEREKVGGETGVDEEVSDLTDIDWDPMAEDFYSSNNNYNAVVDDVGYATGGYKSKELCEFPHIKPRPGAVTADLESVTSRTGEQSAVRAGQHSVLVKIVNIISPSSFYVTFPHGMRNILTIREDSRRESSVSAEYRDLFENLQEEASKTGRGSGLESGLAPGTLVVARAGDGNWHRAMVVKETDLHHMMEVFLVDRGLAETVAEKEVRILGPEHVLLPFQAEEAELSQVEAPGGEGWGTEAAQKLQEITEAADYLSAQVETSLPHGKVVVRLTAVRGQEMEDVGQQLCEAVQLCCLEWCCLSGVEIKTWVRPLGLAWLG